MLYELVYISTATRDMSEADLLEILDVARKNNPTMELTGALIYHNKQFMQVLEGPKEKLFELFHKISKDDRHKDVQIFWENVIEKRNFQDWSMGFKLLSDIDPQSIDGLNDVLENGFNTSDPNNLSVSKQLLLTLRDTL